MKLLVIEDDIEISDFLQKGLTQEGFVVDTATDGKSALSLLMNFEFDLIILDLMIPIIDGNELMDIIKKSHIKAPILVLSAKRSVEEKISGLNRGADDYLVKPFDFSELVARIHALLRRRNVPIDENCLTYLDLRLERNTRKVFRDNKLINLQLKEYSLLELFMMNSERVLSKTYILNQIWNLNFDPQVNVVDVLVFRLRNKIDKNFSDKLIHTVRGIGYVLRQES